MMKHPYLKLINDGLISTQGVVICNDSLRCYSDYESRQKVVTKYATACDQSITLLARHDAPAST